MQNSTPSLPGLGQAMALLATAGKLAAARQYDQAVQAYVRAIDACPLYAASYCDFITMLLQLNEVANAARVVAAIPPQVYQGCRPAQNLHGVVLLQQGRYAEAVEVFLPLVGAPGINPGPLFHNLGTCFNRQDRLAEARDWYERALAAGHASAEILRDLAGILQKLEDVEGAARLYERALKRYPANSDLRYEYALFLLRREDYARGFRYYAERWRAPTHGMHRVAPPLPLWDGKSTVRRLLVLPEQGVGDQVVFSAFLGLLMTRAGRVTSALDARLAPLLLRSFPGLEALPADASLEQVRQDFDACVHAADLGGLFPDAVNWTGPYLQPDRERAARLRAAWQARFPGKTLVGISWRSTRPDFGDLKSIPLPQWQPVLQQQDCVFINLQYGDVTEELRAVREQCGVEIHVEPGVDCMDDLDGVAALANACDRVITTSNSNAHLAAATGAPTWVLLPRGMGVLWYWGFAPDRTRWYPHIRLFRNRDTQDWSALIARVAAQLGEPTS